MQGLDEIIAPTVVLDPSGRLLAPLPAAFADKESLVQLYRTMVLTRLFDRAAINLQRTGAMGTYPSIEGQEAIGSGVGFALHADDVFVPYYRDIGTQIQRGVRLEEILLYWGGDERGSDFQDQREDFPICVPIATQSCHAVGVAYAMKYRKQHRAVLTTCGDGATSKGDFYESINVAGAMHLPVVFVVNNNQWAISVPLSKQTAAKTIAQKGVAAGIDSYRVDGNDPVGVFQVVNEALDRARNDFRPSIVEALSYRLGDHTTADDASRYRESSEFEQARKLEPLIRMKAYLLAEQQWQDSDDRELYEACAQQISQAVESYQKIDKQEPGEFFDFMFAEPTVDLEKQKKEWLAEVRRHG